MQPKVQPSLLYLLVSLSSFTETIYSAALPQIARQLQTVGSVAQLSSSAYYFGFALGILTLGRISDSYGRKPVVIFGISFYILSTFLISISPNIEFFIICRLMQAYGASVGSVIAQTMSRDCYKGLELSYIYTSVAIIISIVPAIGSVVGGYIMYYYHEWQYIFRFLIFISLIMLISYIKFLPETNVYIGINNGGSFFSTLETIIKDKKILSYGFIVGAYNGIILSFYIQAPFIFIQEQGMSSAQYGKLFLILSGASLCGGLISRFLLKKFYSTLKIRIIGFIVSIIGCIGLNLGAAFSNDMHNLSYSILLIFVPMALQLMGHALLVPLILRHALEDYNKGVGCAGSIFGFMYYSITACITLIISNFHSNNINNFAYLFAVLLSICIGLFYCTNLSKTKTIAS